MVDAAEPCLTRGWSSICLRPKIRYIVLEAKLVARVAYSSVGNHPHYYSKVAGSNTIIEF